VREWLDVGAGNGELLPGPGPQPARGMGELGAPPSPQGGIDGIGTHREG